MRDLYKAYSAVHDTTIKEELDNSKDQISAMNLGQLTEGDLLEVCEEIVEGLFQYGCTLDTVYEVVGSVMESTVEGELPAHRKSKIVRISEAFDKTFEKVASRAERNCEEEFLKYRTNKPLNEKWNSKLNNEVGNEKLHAALIHEDRETIKGGLVEMISDIIEARKSGESPQEYAKRATDKFKGGKSKTYDPMKDKNFDHDKAEKTRGSMEEGDSSYLETDMKKRQKNNEKARKDMEKVPSQKNPHFEEVSTLRKGWGDAYASIYEKKLDPVNPVAANKKFDDRKDQDLDNDGDADSTDKYLHKRRKAIAKSLGKDVKEGKMSDEDVKKRVGYTSDENRQKRLDKIKVKFMKKEEIDQKKNLNIRGNDSAEQKARLEKKRGMKLDDHPQFKKEELDQKKNLNIRGNDSGAQKARLEKKRGMKLDDHPQFKKEELESEGYMPMTPERTARVDKAKSKAYDKDMMAQSKGDTKGADKQFKRRMAMDSQTKMKKEENILEKDMLDKQGNDKFDRSKRMIRHKQDKYGVSTLKQRIMTGADHNTDNERKAKMNKEEVVNEALPAIIPAAGAVLAKGAAIAGKALAGGAKVVGKSAVKGAAMGAQQGAQDRVRRAVSGNNQQQESVFSQAELDRIEEIVNSWVD